MVKGIINAFDHMGFCLVLNLQLHVPVQMANGLLYGHHILLLSMLVLLPTFTLGSKYLLPVKKVNFFNTDKVY